MRDIKITTYRNVNDMGITISAQVSDVTTAMDNYAAAELVHEIARLIAERYVAENYAELVKNLDQQAIANLAVADAGKKIAEEIRSKPTVLHDGHKTTVNKYSIF